MQIRKRFFFTTVNASNELVDFDNCRKHQYRSRIATESRDVTKMTVYRAR
jgi:hypothetical protein